MYWNKKVLNWQSLVFLDLTETLDVLKLESTEDIISLPFDLTETLDVLKSCALFYKLFYYKNLTETLDVLKSVDNLVRLIEAIGFNRNIGCIEIG